MAEEQVQKDLARQATDENLREELPWEAPAWEQVKDLAGRGYQGVKEGLSSFRQGAQAGDTWEMDKAALSTLLGGLGAAFSPIEGPMRRGAAAITQSDLLNQPHTKHAAAPLGALAYGVAGALGPEGLGKLGKLLKAGKQVAGKATTRMASLGIPGEGGSPATLMEQRLGQLVESHLETVSPALRDYLKAHPGKVPVQPGKIPTVVGKGTPSQAKAFGKIKAGTPEAATSMENILPYEARLELNPQITASKYGEAISHEEFEHLGELLTAGAGGLSGELAATPGGAGALKFLKSKFPGYANLPPRVAQAELMAMPHKARQRVPSAPSHYEAGNIAMSDPQFHKAWLKARETYHVTPDKGVGTFKPIPTYKLPEATPEQVSRGRQRMLRPRD